MWKRHEERFDSIRKAEIYSASISKMGERKEFPPVIVEGMNGAKIRASVGLPNGEKVCETF